MESSIQLLRQKIRDCQECGLRGIGAGPVGFMGKRSNPLLFVLEYPDDVENHNHRPASSSNGTLIRKELTKNGFDSKFASFAYTFNCWPGSKGKINEEAEACHTYLRPTIEILQPKIVVYVGDLSWIAFSPTYLLRLQEVRGHYWKLGFPGDPLGTGILNPTDAQKDPHSQSLWEIDMSVLVKVSNGAEPPCSEFCLKCGAPNELMRFRGGLPVCRKCVKKGIV